MFQAETWILRARIEKSVGFAEDLIETSRIVVVDADDLGESKTEKILVLEIIKNGK